MVGVVRSGKPITKCICIVSCTLGICQPCQGDGSAESHVTMVGVVIHRVS